VSTTGNTPQVSPFGQPAAVPARYNILALSGGGYRGLFSAVVLERLEAELRRADPGNPNVRLRDRFALVAGTSIGGLLACGIALGIPASTLRRGLEEHARNVFPALRVKRARRFFGALYDPGKLATAIDHCLGEHVADRPMNSVEHPLLVPAVSWIAAKPRVFKSVGLVGSDAASTSVRDVCLATAAAPTYFPPHRVDGDPLLDGGLIAIAPDTIAIVAALKRWNVPIADLHVLSIGTAGVDGGGMSGGVPDSGRAWARGMRLLHFSVAAQERLVLETCRLMLGHRFLRINHTPGPGLRKLSDLDVVDASMTGTLKALADAAYETERPALNSFLT
jgi:uncharacterized protein